MTHPVVDVQGASKNYLNVAALSRVDFTVGPGEVRALLGKNGAGKSTLIRIIAGAEMPDSGAVYIGGSLLGTGGIEAAKRLGVSTVYQELSLIPSMTVAENMFMGRWPRTGRGIDYRQMAELTEMALQRLGVHIDPSLELARLGIAEQQLVEIARSLLTEPKLLILDEPTSSLAANEVSRVLGIVNQISADGVAVIYVSHRLGEIRQIATTASIMRDGQLVDTSPIGDLSTAEVVTMMLGETAREQEPVSVAPNPHTEIALSVRGVVAEPKLHGIDLDIRVGEVLGIAGILGSGRTELLEVIAGLTAPQAGTVLIDGENIAGRGHRTALQHGIGMTPENRKEDGIFPELGIDENIVASDWKQVSVLGIVRPGQVQSRARSLMKNLAVKASSPRTLIGTLSGGNQQKVVIARWLYAKSGILLLDEPTRGVDIEAKAQIYALMRDLARAGTTVVFVSSEVEELPSVCDRVVTLRGGKVAEEFLAPNIRTDALLASAIAAPGLDPTREVLDSHGN